MTTVRFRALRTSVLEVCDLDYVTQIQNSTHDEPATRGCRTETARTVVHNRFKTSVSTCTCTPRILDSKYAQVVRLSKHRSCNREIPGDSWKYDNPGSFGRTAVVLLSRLRVVLVSVTELGVRVLPQNELGV